MKKYFISVVAALAGFSVSCVHQTQQLSGIPPLPGAKKVDASPVSAMERQISNATDAGDGDYQVRALRQKMAAQPDNLEVRLELIEHYAREGYPELALEHCRLAAVEFPESADIQLRMAKLLDKMKLSREAADGLEKFLTVHPQKSPEYESWLGIRRDGLKDWKAGEKAHRAALALDTTRDSLHNNLGYNLLMQNRPAEAALEFREALKLRPDSEVARNNLGMALASIPAESKPAPAAIGSPAGGANAAAAGPAADVNNDALLHWQSISDPATAHSNMAALLISQKRYPEARRELDIALGYNKTHVAALANLKLVSELDGKPAVIPIRPATTKWSRFRSAFAKIIGG